MLRASGNHSPDPLTPAAALLAPRALRDASVDGHATNRLFRQVVRRVDAGRRDEVEVGFPCSRNRFARLRACLASGTHVVPT